MIVDDMTYEGLSASCGVYIVLGRRNLGLRNGSWKGHRSGELGPVLAFGVCVDRWGIDRWEGNGAMNK